MDDHTIIALYWDRDQAAIPATRKKYGGYCHTVAAGILSDRRDREECLNDTWLAAWNAMPPQRPRMLSAFLARITRNLALDRYRYNRAARRYGGGDALLSELEDVLSTSGETESEFLRGELARCISDFLRSLRAEERKMFVRRYWYGDDMAYLAKLFGISENSAAVKLFRVRKKMKTYLEKEGFFI